MKLNIEPQRITFINAPQELVVYVGKEFRSENLKILSEHVAYGEQSVVARSRKPVKLLHLLNGRFHLVKYSERLA